MNNNKKIAGLLSGIMLTATIGVPFANAQENTVTNNINIESPQDEQEFKETMKNIVLENKDDFNDPSYADYLINKIDSSNQTSSEIMLRGKFTLTAKAGAKALKVAMDKIGKKAWDSMVKSIEKNFGTKLVVLHWEMMNKTINVLSNSSTTITDALTDFLCDNAGFNRVFAEIIARAFVTVVL